MTKTANRALAIHTAALEAAQEAGAAGRDKAKPSRPGVSKTHAARKLPAQRKQGRPSAVEAETVINAQEQFLKDKWGKFIALLQEGSKVQESLDLLDFKKYALQGIIRTNETLNAQYEEAKIMGLWNDLDIETVEDIMVDVAAGQSLQLSCEDRLMSHHKIMKLCLKDPVVKDLYDDAQIMRMENMSYEILEIGDDSSDDMGQDAHGGDKPNTAAVQRHRLMSDNRKWLMARLNHRKFGDRIKQDIDQRVITDHSTKLDDARKRKEKLHRDRQNTD